MSNPSRGCGKKKSDAFYLEGGAAPSSRNGNIWAWTWCLGDGIDNIAPLEFPPRQVLFINPAACIATGDIVMADDDFKATEWQYPLYARMCKSTRTIGVGDHVGANNYSAVSFARETNEYGLSRRISKNIAATYAAIIAKAGAIPVLFTHSRVPVFKNITERKLALEIALEVLPGFDREGLHTDATWAVDNWGMYCSKRRDQYNGEFSAMIPILDMVSYLDCDLSLYKNDAFWLKAKGLYDSFIYQEQTIGLGWIQHVTYTLPDNKEVEKALLDVPGLRFLDLTKEEYLNA